MMIMMTIVINCVTTTIYLGEENAYQRRILYKTKGWVNDYDDSVDPSIINEFSNAAFRYFHSLIAGRLL